ncbi:non-ribosomal peptide synthetase [Streptomyces zagrosensis]|uniref:Amino acid adenylation domain-containing protein n=1 Tax=Streptomyces zagrosensis TaxID=1042984 RepID=A0A7W9QIX9_9ACTN|nr:amino acid adenylation domain-containing protein [Streptomyces zagrosensis]MBB5940092.1 amino acid adenylation domain-containing protein [Streptomyces zagrosensis]
MSRYVHEVIEATTTSTPDAIAVQTGEATLTYRELDTRANRIAHHLRAAGVGPESVVGVLLSRGPDTLPCLLGIWKAGGSHLPLDAGLPADRLNYMLETSGARLIVTEGTLAERVGEGYEGEFIHLDRARTEIAGLPGTAPDASAVRDPADVKDEGRKHRLAYTLFTSGSTGRPKGVQIGQYALLNLLFSMRQHYGCKPEHVWLAATPLSFDISTAEMYLPLISGGRVVLADDEVSNDPADQLKLIDNAGVTHVQATPAGWKLLLAAGLGRRPLVGVTSGEECSLPLARDLRSRLDTLFNQYGPTETTVWSHVWDVVPDPESIVLGRPLPNYRTYVLDAAQQPVPVGVAGEVYIAGAGTARGYVGRPGLTAERFVPEPFGGPPGSRMYRSGDLGRFRSDGDLEFLGRIDFQVKIRGYRIELGEIEELLLTHPGVRDAVVVAREDANGEKWLAAYVVSDRPDGEAELDQAELRDHLAASLPSYMVPAAFMMLAAMPLSPTGKLDRTALPAPGRTALVTDREYVAPRNRTEQLLVDTCVEVLGVAEVGVRDRLTDLGADSMRIVHVMTAARRAGLELTLRMLLDSETIEDLAVALDGGTPNEGDESDEGATPVKFTTASRSALSAPEVAEAMVTHGVPGAVVALLRDGQLVGVQAYGTRNAETGAPVTLRTRFQAGSISKHVTAFAVLRLVDQGVLDLDADIDGYLSDRKAPRAIGGSLLTLRHLLSNTAGLSQTSSAWWRPDETMPELSAVLDDVWAEHEPGAFFRKAGSQWAMVEQLLLDVTGHEFQELAAELVFRPLGMRDSTFLPPPVMDRSVPQDLAVGHDQQARGLLGGYRLRPVHAGSGLWSTPADLAQLAVEIRQAHLGLSGLLSATSVGAMLTEAFPGSFYGLGTVVDGSSADPDVGHGGQTAGYRALTSMQLGSGNGCVVMTNSDNGKQVHKAVAALLGRELEVAAD